MMINTRIHWGRIMAGGLLAEVALILAIVPLGLRLGENFLHYTAPPGSFVTCLLGALWVGRRIESRFVLHGTLVGVVAALIYVGLTRAQPEPLAYIVAHALKLIGGACGGFVARRCRFKLGVHPQVRTSQIPERYHRVHAQGPAGGEVAASERDRGEQRSRPGQGDGVGRTDAK
jgi:putative membrane protein (TIGR04086 family)